MLYISHFSRFSLSFYFARCEQSFLWTIHGQLCSVSSSSAGAWLPLCPTPWQRLSSCQLSLALEFHSPFRKLSSSDHHLQVRQMNRYFCEYTTETSMPSNDFYKLVFLAFCRLCILTVSAAMALPFSSFPNVNSLLIVDDFQRPYLAVQDFIITGVPMSIASVLVRLIPL